jgi:hypothetical protein
LASSGLQQSDINVSNLLSNLYAGNTSNPAYPQLQSLFNNAIAFYARAMGVDPNQLVTSLATTAQGSSLSQLFSSLDSQARTYQQTTAAASTGNTQGTTVNPVTPPATPNQNGHTPGQVVDPVIGGVHTQFRVNPDGSYTRIQ